MVDFWELLGHIVTDDKFRQTMFSKFAGHKYPIDPASPLRCFITQADYDQARELVWAKNPDRPISMLALGEWLAISRFHDDIRDPLDRMASIVQKTLAARRAEHMDGAARAWQTMASRRGALLSGYRFLTRSQADDKLDPLFYQALGVSAVDAQFRTAYARGRDCGFGFTNPVDKQTILSLIKNDAFVSQANRFQSTAWTAACKDMMFYWASDSEHPLAHPLEDHIA